MQITISRGPTPGTLDDFTAQVKWLPGMGPKKATALWTGMPQEIVVPPEKEAATNSRIRMLTAVGMIATSNPDLNVTPNKEPAPMNAAPVTDPVTAPSTVNPSDLDVLRRLLGGGMDEARVVDLIHKHGGRPAHVTIDLRSSTRTFEGESMMHHKFPLLAAAVAAGVNVMLVGPAGSGKTTAASKVAEALGLPFYGTGAINSEYKLTGFIDAQGRIVSTAFRKAFEFGGVFLFDEYDGSLPGATLPFNAALANDWMDFPDGCVKRHPDFRVIAGANTYGTGADRQYVGRNQLDAASLDRFAMLDWPYDEALEAAILGAPAPKNAPVPASIAPLAVEEAQGLAVRFLERTRSIRKAVDDLKVRHVVSPRAAVAGAKLLAAGWKWNDVEDAVIWKGIDKDARVKIAAKAA